MHSAWLWSILKELWNFYKLKSEALSFWGNQFGRRSELFGPPFIISILKVLCTQIHHDAWNLNAFCMIEEFFSQKLEMSTN